jgi:hypothetical protein
VQGPTELTEKLKESESAHLYAARVIGGKGSIATAPRSPVGSFGTRLVAGESYD